MELEDNAQEECVGKQTEIKTGWGRTSMSPVMWQTEKQEVKMGREMPEEEREAEAPQHAIWVH